MANVIKKTELFKTNDIESVYNQCEMTRRHRLMTGLIADTGMGKTTSLTAYAQTHERTFVVTVDKTMNAKRLFLSILDSLGTPFDGNIHDVILRISETLNALDNPLLIIDEAGKLNQVMMLYMHVLREHTKGNCGILLAGMPYFRKNLQKGAEKQKEGCSEFLRRINLWHELKGLSRKEIEYICQKNGITGDLRGFYGSRFGDLMNKILLETINREAV